MPVPRPVLVFSPLLSNWRWIKKPLALESRRIEQCRGPFPQRSTQPMVNWHAKAHLRTIDKRAGHIPVQQLTQRPLAAAPLDAHRRWHTPSQLYDRMVEKRSPGLETDTHARSIYFDQNVIRQVRD